MQLLVEVVGALAAGLLVWVLARSLALRGRPAAATVVVVAIVAGALLSAPRVRTAIAEFTVQRHANEAVTTDSRRVATGEYIEANVGFFEWTAERIAPGEEFQLICPSGVVNQWASYLLEPRLEVLEASPGDWVIFYESSPDVYESPEFEEVQVYEPGFALGRKAQDG
jgi:hypothetical protein